MPDPSAISLSSFLKFARKFVEQLRALSKIKQWRRRKPKRLFSDLNVLSSSSSFAALEASNQLKQVFQFLDANGDGKISPMELSEVLLSLGHVDKSTAAKEAEAMVKEMDRNGDGLVDLDEFMLVVNVGYCKSEEEEDVDDSTIMDAFLVFDSDKNGFISAEELQKILISLGCDNCSLKECSQMIKGVDRDGDGFVNFEEFRSMMMTTG